ncbi:MAG: tetratricopeptide repeat protein [Candidatus Gastranaerophilales bacterium]|nr:tetratricopeptide repeat protein [Candidatus Gastranaerophilales bacterium]
MLNSKNKIFILLFTFLVIINPLYDTSAFSKTPDAIYYYNTGVNFQNKGRNELAIKNYKQALVLNPKLSNARNNLLYAYISLATKYYQNKQYTLAIQNFKNALNINSRMPEIYYNLGLAYDNVGQTEQAIKSYEKALKINPSFDSARNNLSVEYFNSGIKYCNNGMYDQAVRCYKKGLEYDPKDAKIYYNLGVTYNLMGQNEEAILNYNKALKIDPKFADAGNNLKVSIEKKEDRELSRKIDNLSPVQKAPPEIYNLVRLDRGVNYAVLDKLYEILDLIWSDPDGQKLLSIIKNHNIPVIITQGSENTNAKISVTNKKNVITYAGIPLFSYKTGQNKEISVNIGESHILAFKNPALTSNKRIYSLHVVIHELCHAVKNSVSKTSDNALNEEITASMIGYNAASRIIRGKDLSENEARKYAEGCMQVVLNDEHRFLPVYNNFVGDIQKSGINPPYLYLYQNVVQLYKSVRDDPQTQRVDTLERMISGK